MEISFNVVVLLRTDKPADASGHPVDRIQLHSFVRLEFNPEDYEATHTGFLKWSAEIDEGVKRFLSHAMSPRVPQIFGLFAGTENDTSEYHCINVADIRNIAVTDYEETKVATFSDAMNISL